MPTANDFLRQLLHQTPAETLDPRLRTWKARLAESGASATLEIERTESEFGQHRPEMHLHFVENGKLQSVETIPWDDDLNTGLIHQVPKPVRAVSPEQEAERFALGLRAALRKAGREFGDGYFNAVLVRWLHDNELTRNEAIADVLKHVRVGQPSPSHDDCRQMVADAIGGRLSELNGPLKYTWEEATHILISALARYLDDRFSVSNRRRLGLL